MSEGKVFLYGKEVNKHCSCGKEIEASKASDVDFGEWSSDVVAIYCPEHGIIECFKY